MWVVLVTLLMRILPLLIPLLLSACSTMHSKRVDPSLTATSLPLLPQYVVADAKTANKTYAQSTMPIIEPPTWEPIQHAWADQISLPANYTCMLFSGDKRAEQSALMILELLSSQQSWVPRSGVMTTRVTLAFAPDY